MKKTRHGSSVYPPSISILIFLSLFLNHSYTHMASAAQWDDRSLSWKDGNPHPIRHTSTADFGMRRQPLYQPPLPPRLPLYKPPPSHVVNSPHRDNVLRRLYHTVADDNSFSKLLFNVVVAWQSRRALAVGVIVLTINIIQLWFRLYLRRFKHWFVQVRHELYFLSALALAHFYPATLPVSHKFLGIPLNIYSDVLTTILQMIFVDFIIGRLLNISPYYQGEILSDVFYVRVKQMTEVREDAHTGAAPHWRRFPVPVSVKLSSDGNASFFRHRPSRQDFADIISASTILTGPLTYGLPDPVEVGIEEDPFAVWSRPMRMKDKLSRIFGTKQVWDAAVFFKGTVMDGCAVLFLYPAKDGEASYDSYVVTGKLVADSDGNGRDGYGYRRRVIGDDKRLGIAGVSNKELQSLVDYLNETMFPE
eukprot:GHVQ01040934.1.p1 GENE.GHVQ01040934.1~~GHVQ01040934.1.p1  ORF type:complete len:420 (-),score=53.45 GHVQ01040934.1:157-1416(-)